MSISTAIPGPGGGLGDAPPFTSDPPLVQAASQQSNTFMRAGPAPLSPVRPIFFAHGVALARTWGRGDGYSLE